MPVKARHSAPRVPPVSNAAAGAPPPTPAASLETELPAVQGPESANVVLPSVRWQVRKNGTTTTIVCSVELTIADTAYLQLVLLRILVKGSEVELELANVSYIDAAILQLTYAAKKTAHRIGARLTLRGEQAALTECALAVGMSEVLLAE